MTLAILLFILAAVDPASGAVPRAGAVALADRGNESALRGDYDEAIVAYDRAVTLQPGCVAAFRGRAITRLGKNEVRRALDDLTEVLRIEPGDAGTHLLRANLSVALGDHDAALADLQEAIRLDAKSAAARLVRAALSLKLGQRAEALADVVEAIRLDPSASEAYALRAGIRLVEEDLAGAVSDLNQAVRLDPKNTQTLTARACVLRVTGAWDRALADLDAALRIEPDSVPALKYRAMIRAACPVGRLRDGTPAVADATRACRLTDWRDGELLDVLAGAYAEAGNFTDAIRYCKLALECAGPDTDWPDRVRARLKGYEANTPYRLEK